VCVRVTFPGSQPELTHQQSIKEHSTPLSGIVVPLVRESLSLGVLYPFFSLTLFRSPLSSSKVAINLDEDGMNLWITALRNTVTIESLNGTAALFDLFPLAMSLLTTNLDLLGKTVNIVESYFLLDGPRILQVRILVPLASGD
jgi:hypothetical protein